MMMMINFMMKMNAEWRGGGGVVMTFVFTNILNPHCFSLKLGVSSL